MRKTKYTVKPAIQFKKEYKMTMKCGLKINLLEDVIAALAMGKHFQKRTKTMPSPGRNTDIYSNVRLR